MNPIDTLFQQLRSHGRKAFIPFIAAGDPDIQATARILRELEKAGASLIELGFPYSDPIADGAVIQASYTRALDHGLKIDDVFACAREQSRRSPSVPLVAMVSYSLVYRRGAENFLKHAQASGFSGAIVPDLPADEARALAELAKKSDFKLIQLVTPTTPRDRAIEIAKLSTGFLYCVSVTGITGERDQLPDALLEQLRWLRQQTDLPLCVGFGVSKPEHVKMLRESVDGVIVGSAFVRKLEKIGDQSLDEAIQEIGTLARSLIAALNS